MNTRSSLGKGVAVASGRPAGLAPPFGLRTSVLDRRRFFGLTLGGAAALALAACGGSGGKSSSAFAGPDESQLPTSVPTGTSLTIAQPQLQMQLQLAGLYNSLPFKVPSWPNIAAGPDVINAFRANSLDLASNAGIPAIQSHFQDEGAPGGGLNTRIVAINLTRVPTYIFATRPHSDIQTTADFKGKKLAFSQGQAQGVVLLRALQEAGLKQADVTLVPLTSDQFLTALQASQVDIAPIGITTVDQYINQYAKDGAHKVPTDVIDRLTVLWAPGSVLANQAKLAAIAAYVPLWAKGLVWQWENPDAWAQKWYVENQGIKLDQAKAIIAASSKPLFPASWDEAMKWEQDTADLLAEGGYVKKFDTSSLFDRRFESLAPNAVDAQYRS